MSATNTEVTCDVREVLDRIGDRWTLPVIVELFQGPRRFRQLERGVEGISQRMLTLTLRKMERDGLVERTVYPTVPAQVEYELTPTGRSLSEVLQALAGWAAEHREVVIASRARWREQHPDTRS
ncbi:winged helix-turn-helix transcriptional regulator [Nonomuraea rhizosphaerae]|uniref:winged helix-turn-helix transcriptional regulator n=1 Tax=Nonomuraea rhizosphaerae TaxID=2665663 RepID=UPI0027E30E96|nr:helix-turn-helix domain-containing protein [Nonomuraea rhizosphaerae]